MNSIPPPKRGPLPLRRIAAATASAVGAALLIAPGTAAAQDEIDCTALGDNPTVDGLEGALETAIACETEVRIPELSSPYSTVYATPDRQLHLVATMSAVQEDPDQGMSDPALTERDGALVQTSSPWEFRLRNSDEGLPLFASEDVNLNWAGEVPAPTYSGTTAVYDELAAGLDLTVDLDIAMAELEFTADDLNAWNALASGLTTAVTDPDARLSAADSYLRVPKIATVPPYSLVPTEWTTRFTVRDAEGAINLVEVSLDDSGALTMSLPEDVLDTAAYPLTLTTQWTYRDASINDWGSISSAAPAVSFFRGEAGLDQPYFEAAGQAANAVVGSYCDALVDPECAAPHEAKTFWHFPQPAFEDVRPTNAYDFYYPVASATFQVEAAEGTACLAPELELVTIFDPAADWTDSRLSERDVSSAGVCQDRTAVYDATELYAEGARIWLYDNSVTFGMTASAETARFDGGSARLDAYLDVVGLDYQSPSKSVCGSAADDLFSRDTTHGYGGFEINTWRPADFDLGLTWTATIYETESNEAVFVSEPREVVLGERPAVSVDEPLADGEYRIKYEFTSSTTGFTYHPYACYFGVDATAPEFVEFTVDPVSHHLGDSVTITATVDDAGFPSSWNELKVQCRSPLTCGSSTPVYLRSDTTVSFDVELDSYYALMDFSVYDQVGNYDWETLRIAATAPHGDYDGDGHKDLLTVRRSDGRLMLHAGRGDGTFESGVLAGTGWDAMDVVMAGDLTGDGHPDLLARDTRSGNLYTYPGDGTGRFPYGRISIGGGWNGMSAITSTGDYDHDRDVDLLAIRKSDGKLFYYYGKGDGTFGPAYELGDGWDGVDTITTIGDVNRDGYYDLLARDSGTNEYFVATGGQGLTFDDRVALPSSLGAGASDRRYSQFVTVGDLDEDGYEDVVAVDATTGELVLHSFDQGLSPLHDGKVVGSGWSGLRLPVVGADHAYDYDGDIASDVVAREKATGDVVLYAGTGTGGFESASLMGANWDSMDLIETAGDFDGDGWADLLARHGSTGTLYLYSGDGQGGFHSGRITVGGGWNSMSAIVGGHDYDGDGRTDILAREASTGYLWFYPGTGTGSHGDRELIGTGWNSMREITAVGDLDHDGHADLIAINKNNDCLYRYNGSGEGTIASRTQIGCGWDSMDQLAGIGDFNGDGHTDWIARLTTNGNLYLYQGNGQGGHSRPTSIGTGWNTIDTIA